MDSVRAAGGVVEATICYTGDVSDPSRKTVSRSTPEPGVGHACMEPDSTAAPSTHLGYKEQGASASPRHPTCPEQLLCSVYHPTNVQPYRP